MNNNEVLKKMTIALNLHHDVIREVFFLGGLEMTVRQTGAFLVSPENKNYKELGDEAFGAFLDGLIDFSRGPKDDPEVVPMLLGGVVEGLAAGGKTAAVEALKEMVDEVYEELGSRSEFVEEDED